MTSPKETKAVREWEFVTDKNKSMILGFNTFVDSIPAGEFAVIAKDDVKELVAKLRDALERIDNENWFGVSEAALQLIEESGVLK